MFDSPVAYLYGRHSYNYVMSSEEPWSEVLTAFSR